MPPPPWPWLCPPPPVAPASSAVSFPSLSSSSLANARIASSISDRVITPSPSASMAANNLLVERLAPNRLPPDPGPPVAGPADAGPPGPPGGRPAPDSDGPPNCPRPRPRPADGCSVPPPKRPPRPRAGGCALASFSAAPDSSALFSLVEGRNPPRPRCASASAATARQMTNGRTKHRGRRMVDFREEGNDLTVVVRPRENWTRKIRFFVLEQGTAQKPENHGDRAGNPREPGRRQKPPSSGTERLP